MATVAARTVRDPGAPHRWQAVVAGTGTLLRHIVRRDRVLLTVWLLVAALFPLMNSAGVSGLFPTYEARRAFAVEMMGNPMVRGFLGQLHGTSVESLVAWRTMMQCVVVTTAGSVLFVIRHTRVEEQSGRAELLGAGPVGRHAGLVAALGVVCAGNALIALLVAGVLALLSGFPVGGSVAFALAVTACGLLFAAVAAVAAQLAQSATAARVVALLALAVSVAMRTLGDAQGAAGTWLAWASPVGWTAKVRPYAGEQWWVLGLFAGAMVALAAVAWALRTRRDVGSGLVPPRAGRAAASPALRGTVGLAWRLHRGSLAGHVAFAAALGAAFGWVSAGMSGTLASSPALAQWLASLRGASLGEAFLVMSLYLLALWVGAYAVPAALRARGEELGGHADHVLSAPVGRLRWLGGHLCFAVAGPALVVLVLGVCAGLAYGLASGQPGAAPRYITSVLQHLPAVWTVTGASILLYGLLPRAALRLSWAVLTLFVLLIGIWEARLIGPPLIDPFAYTHPMLAPTPLAPAVLTVVAAAMVAAGAVAFRARSLGGTP